MEISEEAPRLLVQDGRFVKIFCAVLRAIFKTILPFKNPPSPSPDTEILYLGGAKLELMDHLSAFVP